VAAFIADSDIFGRSAGDDQLVAAKPRLDAERAAGALLAGEAMAHRNADRLAGAVNR
jgi:hypothetical protein